MWADKISDPVHMKSNVDLISFDSGTITVKQEFSTWANRSATLFYRLDDVDVERCGLEMSVK